MLESHLISNAEKDLVDKNYRQFLVNLRRIGRPIKKAWLTEPEKDSNISEKFSSKSFKNFLCNKYLQSYHSSIQNNETLQQLKNKLSLLEIFLTVWVDEAENDNSNSLQNSKKKRQERKFKATLDKDDRYAIHIALQSMVFILAQQSELAINENGRVLEKFKQLENKQGLISFIHAQIKKLESKSLDAAIDEPSNISEEEFKKIGSAISAFQTPNIKKKIIKYTGIALAFLAAIACGVTTGGAIFLLFSSLPLAGLIFGGLLGILIGIWGFSSNFGFFSTNFPDFLLSFLKKGGISEYIDEEGKRRQLSALKKYLFIPLAVVTSLTVGLGTVAITYTTIITLLGKFLVLSAFIWPPLFPIIAGILAAAVGITLTVAVLTATIQVIKNSQNFSWEAIKSTINGLSRKQIIGYVFKGLLVLLGLFGLAYFRYVAGIDLSNTIQPLIGLQAASIVSIIMSVIAFIPQGFFTLVSTQKLIKLFSPTDNPAEDSSFYHRIYKAITLKSICLVGNAIGNAVLVIVDGISTLSIFGAIGCFVNSWSGNLIPAKNSSERDDATAKLVNQLREVYSSTNGDTSGGAATSSFSTSQTSLKLPSIPEESKGPPSPAKSEAGELSRSEAEPLNIQGIKNTHNISADSKNIPNTKNSKFFQSASNHSINETGGEQNLKPPAAMASRSASSSS